RADGGGGGGRGRGVGGRRGGGAAERRLPFGASFKPRIDPLEVGQGCAGGKVGGLVVDAPVHVEAQADGAELKAIHHHRSVGAVSDHARERCVATEQAVDGGDAGGHVLGRGVHPHADFARRAFGAEIGTEGHAPSERPSRERGERGKVKPGKP